MSSRRLLSGRWVKVANPAEHRALVAYGSTSPKNTDHHARVQMGEYAGPGDYLVLDYQQRCPRNCCDDHVREALPAFTVAREVADEMRDLAELLRAARARVTPALAGGPT